MARKPRLPYECFSCGKRFKSAQGVRGHRRHCRYPRQRKQAEAEAARQPVPTTRVGKRPGPLSHEAKLLLLDAREMCERFRDAALEFAGWAHLQGARENVQAWSRLYQMLEDSLQELEPMVPLFRLDRMPLFTIYERLRRLKEAWIHHRVCEFYRVRLEPDGLDEKTRSVLREEEARLTSLIDHLKRLVVAAP